MTRPARALLSAQALRHNFGRVRAAAPHAKVMAVIKANAYGHGLAWAARVLREADGYAVASVEEGAELRAAQVPQPICLLEGFFDPAELPLIAQHRLAPVIHHAGQVLSLEQAKGVGGLNVWLKVDTGMHRIGFSPQHAADAAARLAACPAVSRVRWMSHFANADNRFDSATKYQIESFLKLVDGLDVERSLANSAGIVAWPASHLEWVRPGIMLYGATPFEQPQELAARLQPVMTLESQIIGVRELPAGEPVGYGARFVSERPTRVGVVAMGYADGYPRHAPTGTPVQVAGRRTRTLGRVSMDKLCIDLSELPPTVGVGDTVTLWGGAGDMYLAADEVAAAAGTVAYELFCALAPRVPVIEMN